MNITLNSIYQNNIDLTKWITSLPTEVTHINLFISLKDKHQVTITSLGNITITLIPIDTPKLFLELNTLYPLNSGWHICVPMHCEISDALQSEIKAIITTNEVNNTLYIKEKGTIKFLDQQLNKGGYQKEPILLLFHQSILSSKGVSYQSIQKLSAPIVIHEEQTFDNFHLELDIQQQILSYIDYLKGKKVHTFQFFTKPLGVFFYRGLLRGSFFEGKAGFALTYLYALSAFKRVLFLNMKYKKID